jgi:hypothetical protein
LKPAKTLYNTTIGSDFNTAAVDLQTVNSFFKIVQEVEEKEEEYQ